MLVVPATREAEAGELLEPGGGRGCSKPRLCHCTPAWQQRETLSQTNKKIIQAWWWAPVTSATWEADAGEFLEPGK